jgi:hypothetical protein
MINILIAEICEKLIEFFPLGHTDITSLRTIAPFLPKKGGNLGNKT